MRTSTIPQKARRLANLLILIACMTGMPAHAGNERPTVTPADLFNITRLDDPALSPDGRLLIYTEARVDTQNDRWRKDVVLVNTAGPTSRRSLFGPDADAKEIRWSPDATRIAYVSGGMVKVLTLATGEVRPLSGKLFSAGQIAWSPDADTIAFAADVPEPPPILKGMPLKPTGAAWAPTRTVTTRFRYRDDCCGYRVGPRHLFVVPSRGGEVRQITSGTLDAVAGNTDIGYSPMTWDPDGHAVIVAAPHSDQSNLRKLVRLPIDGRPSTQLTGKGDASDPIVSPDGRWIAYVLTEDAPILARLQHVAIMPVGGGTPKIIDGVIDRWAQGPLIWSDDSRKITALHYVGGVAQITVTSIAGGPSEIVAPLVGTSFFQSPTGTSFSGSKGTIAFPTLSMDRPAGLTVMRGRKIVAAIDPNREWAASRSVGSIETIRFASSADGLPIEGWVLRPPRFKPDRKYPLILDIHGGPMGAFGPGFSLQHELYAAAGYIVLFVNQRGSNGYGTRFLQLNNREWPGQDYLDLMSAVDLMTKRDYVDTDSMFVSGRSAGGLMTTWIVGQTSRFRAASALAPVTDHIAQALNSDIADEVVNRYFDAPPWESPEAYWKLSPISRVGKVSTPTQIIVNGADYRVPVHEGEAFYQALKFRGIDTELVRIPGTSHVAGSPSQVLETQLTTLDWFERHRTQQAADKTPR